MPQTCQRGSVLRAIASRSARAVCSAGSHEAQAKSGHGPAVVVEDRRQPRLDRAVALVADPDIHLGVVGLPDRVRAVGLAAMHQVVPLSVGLRAAVGERGEGGIEAADDVVDRVVAGHRPRVVGRDGGGLAVDRRHGRAGRAQRHALDQPDQLGRERGRAPIAAGPPDQPGQAVPAVALHPALGGPRRDPFRPRHARQGHTLLQVGAQQAEALQGDGAFLLGERGQGLGGSPIVRTPRRRMRRRPRAGWCSAGCSAASGAPTSAPARRRPRR